MGLSEPSTWSSPGAVSPFSSATKTCPPTHTTVWRSANNSRLAHRILDKYQSMERIMVGLRESAGIESLANSDDANHTTAKLELQSSILMIPSPSRVTPQSWAAGISEWGAGFPDFSRGEPLPGSVQNNSASQAMTSENQTRLTDMQMLNGQIVGSLAPWWATSQSILLGYRGSIPSTR